MISFLDALMILSTFVFVCTFLFVSLAVYAAGVAKKPPWYNPSTPEVGLPQENVPAYWQGISHDPKTDLGIEYQDVEFSAYDGLTLRGWFVPSKNRSSKVGVVCVHGGGRDRRAWLRQVPIFHDLGYCVLLFDFREHGISDGSRKGFTYGVKEHLDVISAVKYVKRAHGVKRVCVAGTSVGAASSIIAAAASREIDAVIAENPLTRPEELLIDVYRRIINYVFPRYMRNSILLRWFGRLTIAIFLYRIGAVEEESLWPNHRGAVDVIHRISPRPILFMHGTSDEIIPYSHSERLFAAAEEPKHLWLAPHAMHCALYTKYPKEYRERVGKFLHDLVNGEDAEKEKVVD